MLQFLNFGNHWLKYCTVDSRQIEEPDIVVIFVNHKVCDGSRTNTYGQYRIYPYRSVALYAYIHTIVRTT